MVASAWSSAYVPLAHGTVNWDTQLRADIVSARDSTAALVGTAATAITYGGTGVDYGSNWATRVTVAGNQVSLTIGANPGANGYTTSSGNKLIGTIGAGATPLLPRPSINIAVPVMVLDSSGNYGGSGWVVVAPDGTINLVQLSISQVLSGMGLAGQAVWRAQ